ncbi:MAG: biotin/lipoyl-binding protein, partial [Betaproteobacteria bacterium]|nr:biotin/lipoyl-binding protein [Betaproteobacteria bacterium]
MRDGCSARPETTSSRPASSSKRRALRLSACRAICCARTRPKCFSALVCSDCSHAHDFVCCVEVGRPSCRRDRLCCGTGRLRTIAGNRAAGCSQARPDDGHGQLGGVGFAKRPGGEAGTGSAGVPRRWAEPVQQVFRVAGRVDFDEKRVSRIGTTVPGRVTELNAWLGQDVKTGAKLASLSSADLSAVQLTYLKAHAQTQLLTRSVERARALLAADVIGSAELQRRQNELEVAEAEKRAAADQLRMLGMADASLSKIESSGAISSVKPLLSTQNGTVVERKV